MRSITLPSIACTIALTLAPITSSNAATGVSISQPAGPNQNSIRFNPTGCIMPGEMPVFQVSVNGPGELRAYFRRTNTTDWCSVQGTNLGPLSSVTLPKFEVNDEIEYFFVLLNGKRVTAKSARVFQAKATGRCETPFARHMDMIVIDCSENSPGTSTPAATAAGFSIRTGAPEPQASPDTPSF